MNKDDFAPEDFTFADLIGNAELVRDIIRFKEQLEAMEVLVACEKRHLSRSETGENMVLDLRVELPPAPVLTVTENDPVITLTWVFEETGYTGVYVERSVGDALNFVPLANLGGDATSYDDADVVVGTEYFYRVRGKRCGIYSPWSNIDSGELSAAVGYALGGWGYNADSQLGDGTITTTNEPAQLDVAEDWVTIASGYQHSIAVKDDGTLWTCGENSNGQLGQGDTTDRNTWTQVGADTDWLEVYTSRSWNAARKVDGSIYVFGENADGQLGLGDNSDRTSPTQVGAGSTWIHVSAGQYNLLLVKDDGTLWISGRGIQGEIGDGNLSNRNVLTQCGGTNWVRGYACFEWCFGVKSDGTGWAWGLNDEGQLGIGNVDSLLETPQQIGAGTNWKAFSGGAGFSVATRTDGTLWVAGTEDYGGELGLGATTDTGTNFVQIGSATNWDYPSCGDISTMVITTTGEIYGTGYNGDGGLGVGDFNDRNTLTREITASTWSLLSAGFYHTLALGEVLVAAGYFLHAWGPNNNGGLGTGDTSPRDEPTAIGASAEWAKMAIGLNHALGIKADGTLWSTGSDSNGQLGRSGAGDVSTFTQIGTDTDWADCACGELHSAAIKTDGRLYTWGAGSNGQLGHNDGFFADLDTPAQVESATDWAAIACGNIHTLAIKTDGTLCACGNNLRGQLGTGAGIGDFDAFAQVGSATWTDISGGGEHSIGVQTDGTLHTWGRNTNGALGQGDTTQRDTPTQVGALTTWSKCSGGERFSAASRTDGTLWTSGANSQGQLGQGDTTQRTSFTQVGSGTDWDYPACGDDFCIALKTTGELFAWGSNGNGQLGLNDTTQRQSPVQIGSGTDWVAVVIGDEFVMALTDV